MRKPSCQISAKAEWLAYAVGMKKHGGDRDNIIIIKKSTNVKETPPDKTGNKMLDFFSFVKKKKRGLLEIKDMEE